VLNLTRASTASGRWWQLATHRPVTFSAGIAVWDGHESAVDVLGRADAAL